VVVFWFGGGFLGGLGVLGVFDFSMKGRLPIGHFPISLVLVLVESLPHSPPFATSYRFTGLHTFYPPLFFFPQSLEAGPSIIVGRFSLFLLFYSTLSGFLYLLQYVLFDGSPRKQDALICRMFVRESDPFPGASTLLSL